MNANQINFAYKVRHALNENLDNLPTDTTAKLAAARQLAMSKRKKDAAPLRVTGLKLGGLAGQFFDGQFSWLGRMSYALPVVVLVAGLAGIYNVEQQQRIAEIAEIDVMVLSDELPLNAYLDNGFNAYLAKRAE